MNLLRMTKNCLVVGLCLLPAPVRRRAVQKMNTDWHIPCEAECDIKYKIYSIIILYLLHSCTPAYMHVPSRFYGLYHDERIHQVTYM